MSSFTGEIKHVRLEYLDQMVKGRKFISKTFLKRIQNNENYIICKNVLQKPGGVKTAVGSELSLVSGNCYENKVSVVMEMASFCLKIRHVFADTSMTEPSIREQVLQLLYSSVLITLPESAINEIIALLLKVPYSPYVNKAFVYIFVSKILSFIRQLFIFSSF